MRIILILAIFLLTSSSLQAKILWIAADNRTGFQINTESENGGKVSDVKSPVRAGTGAFMHSLPSGHARAELKTKPTEIGKIYWYGISYMIPKSWPDSSGALASQFGAFPSANHPFPCRGIGSHFLISRMEGRGDTGWFDLVLQRAGEGKSTCTAYKLVSLEEMRGFWTDFVMHVKWTGNSDGFLKIWARTNNGPWKIRLDYKGATFWNNEGSGPNLKWGLYAGSGGSRTIYTDEMRIGDAESSFQEVAPGGGSPDSQTGTDANFDLKLKTGWNLISLPVSPADSSINSLLSSITGKYDAIYSYDTSLNQYQSYIPGESSNSLSTLEPGRGYWIYLNQDAQISLRGSLLTTSVSLKSGWNLAGFNSTQSSSVDVALKSLEGKFSAVYGFDGKSYMSYIPGDENGLKTLEPGKGYWIYASEAANWTLPK